MDELFDKMFSLHRALESNPLKTWDFERFINEHVVGVKFYIDMSPSEDIAANITAANHNFKYTEWEWDKDEKYVISIDSSYGYEDACISLVHEAIHVLYRKNEAESILKGMHILQREEVIEETAQEFYKENSRLVEELLQTFLDKQKTLF